MLIHPVHPRLAPRCSGYGRWQVNQSGQFVHDFLMTTEGLELAGLFPKINKPKVRRRVLDLVRSMADEEIAEPSES